MSKVHDHRRAADDITRRKLQRRRMRAWFMFFVGVAVLAWLLSRVSLADLVETLARGDVSLIALGLAIGLVATALRTIRFSLFFASFDQLE